MTTFYRASTHMQFTSLFLLCLPIIVLGPVPSSMAQVPVQIVQAPGESTNTPPGDYPRKPGGGLPIETCIAAASDTALSLIAIRPEGSQNGLTARKSPTLLFYIPQITASLLTGEFIIQTRGDLGGRNIQEVYHKTFQLPGIPGILAVTLPSPNGSDTSYLEVNEYYRWYFKVSCVDENGGQIEQVLRGWIRRVTPETAPINTPIYYDELANAVFAESTAEDLEANSWREWLQMIGLEAYAEEPIIGEID